MKANIVVEKTSSAESKICRYFPTRLQEGRSSFNLIKAGRRWTAYQSVILQPSLESSEMVRRQKIVTPDIELRQAA
jgi:hypothetical protein